MLARLQSPLVLAALAAIPTAVALIAPSTSQSRAPDSRAAFSSTTTASAPMHGPTALGYLEFDWNGALPGFSPWQDDATSAQLFPRQADATE